MIQKFLAALRPFSPVLAVVFAFSLIWSWSSGYKDVVTWGAFAYVLYGAIRRREKMFCGGIGCRFDRRSRLVTLAGGAQRCHEGKQD